MKLYKRSSISVIMSLILLCLIFNVDIKYASAATDVPRIILESYDVLEGSFAIGQKTIIKLNLKNTSEATGIENLLITYTSENNHIYSELGDSNQIFLGNVGAGATIPLELTVIVSANTDTDNIPVTFTAEYVNTINDQKEKNEFMLFAPVNNLNMIYNVSVASSARVGTRAFISANILNNGYSLASDVKMTITGNIESDEESKDLIQQQKGNSVTYNIGDIEARTSEYIDTGIVFKEAGVQTVTIAFLFNDNNGEEQFQVAGEYDVNVFKNSNDSTDKQNNKVSPAWVVCIIIGIAGIIVVIIVVYNKRKHGKISLNILKGYIQKIRIRFR